MHLKCYHVHLDLFKQSEVRVNELTVLQCCVILDESV